MGALSYIPPGFEFNPTDQQLVSYYLRRKIDGEDMDDIIPEVDVYNLKPSELLGRRKVLTNESKGYFFTSGSHNQETNFGYWQPRRNKYDIKHNSQVIGRKLFLAFLKGQRGSGQQTGWAMEQYMLEDKDSDTSQIKDRFVLCRITKEEEHFIFDMPAPQQQQMDIFLAAMKDLSPIPPGFGFKPSDQQLVCYYLRRKINGEDMVDIIPEVDVFNLKPLELLGRYKVLTDEPKLYFFTPGSHRNKAKARGYWKKSRKYPVMQDCQSVGTKQRLSFYEGKSGNREKTTWVMHKYLDKDQGKVKDRFALCLVVIEVEKMSVKEISQMADRMTDKSCDQPSIVGCLAAAPEPRPDSLSEEPEDGIPSLIQEENQNSSTKEERSSLETANFVPKDRQVGQSENSKKMKGKEVAEDKSVVTKRAKTGFFDTED
ncbi:NAC domain protein [Carex littledalei]|uniref:NAC domain protein n=1 Tax=Carex littledalei TaxID=544730 RepID=A0A833VZN7_9POAL|nr:NAC domain protein [Carex littledalei]